MTLAAWIFMAIAWATILGAGVVAFKKILSDK